MMPRLQPSLVVCFLFLSYAVAAAGELSVAVDFEGASAREIEIDQEKRVIRFRPGGDPERGWPCWWYLRIDGATPGETLTLQLRGSTETVSKEAAAGTHTGLTKPLASSWAMPERATVSGDGRSWRQTEKGLRQDDAISYTVTADATSMHVAWGPPFTPGDATKLIRTWSEQSPHAKAGELCRSRGGRAVPLLHIREGDLPDDKRFGVWVQARQHAWESGSSWVARGFAEWALSDAAEATWLRRHAEIFVVPIMDVDNAATGNGGKDALPHDHNRDWSDRPVWTETMAAQRKVRELIDAKRLAVFLDLHNPAPGDPTFFYILDEEFMPDKDAIAGRDRLIALSYARISKLKPLIPMSNKPKVTGPKYHPLWKNISANWVALHGNPQTVSVCLETIWNGPTSTTDGYRAVGGALAAATQELLSER